MKKLLIMFCCVAFALTSCEVCTTCTESSTNVEGEFCGSRSEVKEYEDGLENNGLGQNWNCVRD